MASGLLNTTEFITTIMKVRFCLNSNSNSTVPSWLGPFVAVYFSLCVYLKEIFFCLIIKTRRGEYYYSVNYVIWELPYRVVNSWIKNWRNFRYDHIHVNDHFCGVYMKQFLILQGITVINETSCRQNFSSL